MSRKKRKESDYDECNLKKIGYALDEEREFRENKKKMKEWLGY